MILICAACALIGGVLTFKFGKEIVIFGTSIIGSYMFTDGLTLIFDEDYPNWIEIWAKLDSGDQIELN